MGEISASHLQNADQIAGAGAGAWEATAPVKSPGVSEVQAAAPPLLITAVREELAARGEGSGREPMAWQSLTFLPREVRVSDSPVFLLRRCAPIPTRKDLTPKEVRPVAQRPRQGRLMGAVLLCNMRGRWPWAFLSTVWPLQTISPPPPLLNRPEVKGEAMRGCASTCQNGAAHVVTHSLGQQGLIPSVFLGTLGARDSKMNLGWDRHARRSHHKTT